MDFFLGFTSLTFVLANHIILGDQLYFMKILPNSITQPYQLLFIVKPKGKNYQQDQTNPKFSFQFLNNAMYLLIIKMQKKKLDLNHLLAKYEGLSNYISNSPLRHPNPHPLQLQFQPQPLLSKTVKEAYTPQQQVFSSTQQPIRPSQNNFALTKTEIQSFLLSIREEVRNEERSLAKSMEVAVKSKAENFAKMLEQARKQIIETLDQAFGEIQRKIIQQLKITKYESYELTAIHRSFSAIDQEIDRLLASLKGADYRKVIAEVITRDFNIEMSELRAAADTAKAGQLQHSEEIVLDRSQLQAIKNSLGKLVFINRRKSQPGSKREENSEVYVLAKDKAQMPVSQSRQRRSLFSCGGD